MFNLKKDSDQVDSVVEALRTALLDDGHTAAAGALVEGLTYARRRFVTSSDPGIHIVLNECPRLTIQGRELKYRGTAILRAALACPLLGDAWIRSRLIAALAYRLIQSGDPDGAQRAVIEHDLRDDIPLVDIAAELIAAGRADLAEPLLHRLDDTDRDLAWQQAFIRQAVPTAKTALDMLDSIRDAGQRRRAIEAANSRHIARYGVPHVGLAKMLKKPALRLVAG